MSVSSHEQIEPALLVRLGRRVGRSVLTLNRSRVGMAILVLVIASVALVIRAWTIRQSLPYVDHPDEPNPINYVVEMLRTGDPNPHFFQKPSLYVYLLLMVLRIHYTWGQIYGRYGPLDQMMITTHLYTTIPSFFVWGRMLTASLAALTVISLYRVGRSIWNPLTGLIAALFVTFAPFHMRHSQYVTTDVATSWLVLLAFGASLTLARRGYWRDYLLAGACVGLVASTKYNAGIAALMVLVAHLLNAHKAWLMRTPRLVGSGLAALVGFLIGTPYALLSWPEFQRGLLGQVKDYNEVAHGEFVGVWNVPAELRFFWYDGFGSIASVAVLLGLAILLSGRLPKQDHGYPTDQRVAGLIWFGFVIPYLLLHMAQLSHFTRNNVAVIVMGALPIGVAGAAVIEWVRTKWQRTTLLQHGAFYLLASALLIVLLAPSALATWRYSVRQARGDTRAQAIAWIETNIPPGVRIAAEMSPLSEPFESRWAEAPSLPENDLAWYRQQGYAYLLASSDAWRQWDIPDSYQQLAGTPLITFGGVTPRDMLGPRLAIYATGLVPHDVTQPVQDAHIGGTRLAGIRIGQPIPKRPGLGIIPTSQFKAGQIVALRTFWEVEQPFSSDFFVFVHLINAAGERVAQRDTPPWQGRFPTSSWHAGTLVVDVNDLALPAVLPPGEYTILIGMFDPATGAKPPISMNGQPADALKVGQITITP